MKCEEVIARIPDFLRQDAEEGKAMLDVQAHVAGCSSCYNELNLQMETWNALEAWPEQDPSPALSRRFYQMLEGYQEGLASGEQKAQKPSPFAWLNRPWIWQAATALTLVLALLWPRADQPAGDADMSALKEDISSMRRTVGMSLISHDAPGERLNGLQWVQSLDSLDIRMAETLLDLLQRDPSVNVRLASVEVLYQFRNDPGVREGLVRALPIQDAPAVQLALIDCLVAMDAGDAAPGLQQLLEDRDIMEPVREKARLGLREIQ